MVAGRRRAPVTAADLGMELGTRSLQAKALGVHNGETQAVAHLVLAAVGGQQQGVEAGVGGGELVGVGAIPLDDAAQIAQAADGRPITAAEEFEEAPLLLVIKLVHDLPQPTHSLHPGSEVRIDSIGEFHRKC